jgi:hypothetical protein
VTERDLSGIREQVGGIDPALDQAQNYTRAVKEIRGLAHHQGQVMSAALANNHTLYHTNKDLVERTRQLGLQVDGLRRELERKSAVIEALEAHVQRLQQAGGDQWKPLYLDARKVIEGWLFAELSHEQLKESLERMQKQQKDLEGMPETLTPEEILRRNSDSPEDELGPPLQESDAATRETSPFALSKKPAPTS